MTPDVYRAFEEICARLSPRGPVLEVGGVPGPDSLLGMKSLQGVGPRIAYNLETFPAQEGYGFVQGNANDMSCFADGTFGTVLCNATLEHDARFWLSLEEIQRVTAPEGLIIIGVPGFKGMGPGCFASRRTMLGRLLHVWARIARPDVLLAGTPVLGEHAFPGDYYRFTEQAVREVFLAGLVGTGVAHVMNPPRLIGWGLKP